MASATEFRQLIEDFRELYTIATEIATSDEYKDVVIENGELRPTWHKAVRDLLGPAIENAGYEILGDYAPGIELTSYGQVLRYNNEFYRLSASVNLPYTTAGSSPSTNDFLAIGDAQLRSELMSSGFQLVGDGSQTLQEALDARPPAKTATLTVNIPTDYPTLQSALDDLSTLTLSQGVTIDLVIESGHEVSSGVIVEYGDYSHFVIKSEDAITPVSNSFTGDFIRASYSATAPTLGCLVDGKGLVNIAYGLFANSRGLVLPNCGVNNYSGHGLWIYQGSVCDAGSSVFEGGSGPAVRVARASSLNAELSSFINCTASDYVVYVNRGSKACLQSINCDGATAPVVIFASRNGHIDAHRLPSQSCSGDFIKMQRACTIYTGGDAAITITTGGSAIICNTGSTVGIDSNANFVSSNGLSDGILCEKGSFVGFFESSMNGYNRGVVTLRGGSVACNRSVFKNLVSDGFVCQGAHLDADGVTIDTAGGTGFSISRAGSANIRSASIKNVSGTKIVASEGANIDAVGVTVDGSYLALSDTNLPGGFNFADNGNRGFIWN